MSFRSRVSVLLFLLLLCQTHFAGQGTSVIGSKHDLSTGGAADGDPCLFCHTPHAASSAMAVPLWNRKIGSTVTFTPYSSSTLDTQCPATPSAYSMACLGCHDGVNVDNDKHDLLVGPGGTMPDTTSYPNCERCHP